MNDILTRKIYLKNRIVTENIWGDKKVIDIGCGQRKLPGAVGMDIVKNSQADILHDMNIIPWPLKENSYDVIFTHHVLEHAQEPLKFLEEAHRILRPSGRVVIQVPYFRKVDAFADPTHRHFFTAQSLDYVIEGTKLSQYNYTQSRFKKIGFWYGWPTKSHNPLVNIFKKLIMQHPQFYDQYLSLLLPVACLTWELEVIK